MSSFDNSLNFLKTLDVKSNGLVKSPFQMKRGFALA